MSIQLKHRTLRITPAPSRLSHSTWLQHVPRACSGTTKREPRLRGGMGVAQHEEERRRRRLHLPPLSSVGPEEKEVEEGAAEQARHQAKATRDAEVESEARDRTKVSTEIVTIGAWCVER